MCVQRQKLNKSFIFLVKEESKYQPLQSSKGKFSTKAFPLYIVWDYFGVKIKTSNFKDLPQKR